MFQHATAFNQPLNNWQPLKDYNVTNMFQNAISFNQPLHAPWFPIGDY